MPRIPSEFLDCVCYLYENEDDAEKGCEFGGTAFLFEYPSRIENRSFVYAVTNWHVAVRDGFSCLRINTHDGKPDIIPYGPEDWEFDPRYDIAVRLLQMDRAKHKFKMIGADDCITKQKIKGWEIGPGEDVFMVGRFVDHDGGPVNKPALRFGHISVMPSPMEQPNGGMADAYCIDLHSRTGYSGSPVVAYRTFGSDLSKPDKPGQLNLPNAAGNRFVNFLGIHYGQFPEEWELREGKPIKAEASGGMPLLTDGKYVKGLSGMTCVLPSWTIKEVLEMPKLVEQRKRHDDELEQQIKKAGKAIPGAETNAAPLGSDENPNHREDFSRLLDAAARKPKQDD